MSTPKVLLEELPIELVTCANVPDAMQALHRHGTAARLSARQVEPLEQVIDILVEKLRAQHIKRLKDGICSIDTGVVFLDVLNNAERISDHCSNIAARLVGMEAGEDYDSHTLKNMMHHNPTKEYMLNYEQCRKDYLIPLEQLEA